MRLLLAGILVLLPLTAQAESLANTTAGEAHPDSTADSSDDPKSSCNSSSLTDELRLCGNPYSPASPTNFDALIGPYLYVQGQRDLILYDPRFPSMNDGEAHRDRDDSRGFYKPF